jgi:hypothetical protein
MSLLKTSSCGIEYPDEDEREWFDASDEWLSGTSEEETEDTSDADLGAEEVLDLRNAIVDVAKEQRFFSLARAWKKETRFLSSVEEKSVHLAYQRIIGMGEAAVPFILADLDKNGPDDWFWALTVITDENPIAENIAGNMMAMTEAWLQWGRRRGLVSVSQ